MKQRRIKCTCPLPIQQQNLWQQQVMMNASTRLLVYRDDFYQSMHEASDKYLTTIIN
jgi:hypothetical protein